MFALNEASALAREPDVAAALDAVDRYLAGSSGPARFRAARGAADAAVEAEAWRGLAALGIPTAIVPEALGGSGLSAGVVALVGERLGRALARESFVENVVLPVGLALALPSRLLVDAVAKGEILCVAWQEGAFARPGSGEIATTVRREGRSLRLSGAKRFVGGARAANRILVLAKLDGVPVIVAAPAGAKGVARQDKVLADGTFWSDLRFDAVLEETALVAKGAEATAAFAAAVDLANLALAGLLHGLQSRILEMTLDYLATRVQFDQPIGAFQALQHRAVDLYTHAQVTRFVLGEAADALAAGAKGAALEAWASRAKARAADAAHRIAKEGIQMHGGIGFSDEYDLGLYVKRVLVLSAWLGNADWHRRHLAAIEPLAEAVAA